MHASVCDGRYPRAKACYLLYKGIPSLTPPPENLFIAFFSCYLSLSCSPLFLLLLTPLYLFTACLPPSLSSIIHLSFIHHFLHFLLQCSYPLPKSPTTTPKKVSEFGATWGKRCPPLKTSVLSLNSLTPHTRPTHTHPPGGLIQAFISPNRGKDNHSTPMRSPHYHPCECVWMHLCVCLPLEPQSATQRTQEKTWHLPKTQGLQMSLRLLKQNKDWLIHWEQNTDRDTWRLYLWCLDTK